MTAVLVSGLSACGGPRSAEEQTSETGTREAPSVSIAAIDTLTYMLNTSGYTMQDTRSGYGQMQRTMHDSGARYFYYQKNPYESHRWELYFYDDSRIWLYRDTTLPPDEGHGTAYDVEPWDGMWIPRWWSQGDETSFSATFRYFYHLQNPCPNLAPTLEWRDGRHKLRYVGPISLGGNLGTQDVIVIDRYHDVSSNIWNPRLAERFWYAKGYGWVRWEYWPESDRNWDGSPRGDDNKLDRLEDPKWNSSSPSDLLTTSPQKRILMIYKKTVNPGFVGVGCR